MMITSTANLQVKFLRSLHMAKYRRETGLFLAEGLRLVGQAFESKAEIQQIIYAPECLVSEYGQSLVDLAFIKGIDTLEVSQNVFESIARKDKPQGIAALVKQNFQNIEDFQFSDNVKNSTFLCIEAIQNPGNLGSVLRTCDATKVSALFLLPQSTDPYDPIAVKASMGAIFSIPIYKLDYAQLIGLLEHNPSLMAIGTSDKVSQTAFDYNYPNHTLLLIGSEREGLSQTVIDLCHNLVSIPMAGVCDSLNLSVATGIILYELYKQRTGLVRST